MRQDKKATSEQRKVWRMTGSAPLGEVLTVNSAGAERSSEEAPTGEPGAAKSKSTRYWRASSHDLATLLCRIDESVEPTTFRCAIVSRDELTRLRSIEDVVRLGRVGAIEPTGIYLDGGFEAATADTLYIDCSAGALQPQPSLPVFDGNVINLLYIIRCRPLPSAAVIAYVESRYDDEAEKNRLCAPVGLPEVPSDWLALWTATLSNMAQWAKHPAMNNWFNACRLSSTALMTLGPEGVEASSLLLLRESSVKAGAAAGATQASYHLWSISEGRAPRGLRAPHVRKALLGRSGSLPARRPRYRRHFGGAAAGTGSGIGKMLRSATRQRTALSDGKRGRRRAGTSFRLSPRCATEEIWLEHRSAHERTHVDPVPRLRAGLSCQGD